MGDHPAITAHAAAANPPAGRHGDHIAVNVAALRAAGMDETAAALATLSLPERAEFAVALDATPTLTWPGSDGRRTWLGRTHMPRVRADGLIGAFSPGTGNVALVAAGQGSEIRALLARLQPAQALFVVEHDPLNLRAVLALHDFSDDIRSGRLCLFTGDDAWVQFQQFLVTHVGYLVPQRVLHWPWMTPTDAAEFARRFAALNTAVTAAHAASGEGDSVAHAEGRARLCIVAPESGGSGPGLARALARAADSLGLTCACVAADQPRTRSLAHAAAVLRANLGAKVVCINAVRADLAVALPVGTSVLTWLTADAEATPEFVRGVGPSDRVVAPTNRQVEQALRLGLAAARVRHIPLGADPDAGLVAPPPPVPLDAEAVGLGLASQQALWRELVRLARAQVGIWEDRKAEALLDEAGAASGVRLSSTEVRDAIVERIRIALGPGVERQVYGDIWRAALDRAGTRLARTAHLAIPPAGALTADMLDAAAAGALLVVRRHPDQFGPDGWAQVLDAERHVVQFSSPTELGRILDALALATPSWQDRAAAARRHVQAAHLWRHRLEAALAG